MSCDFNGGGRELDLLAGRGGRDGDVAGGGAEGRRGVAGRGEGAGLGGEVEGAGGGAEVRGGVAGVLDALGGGDGVLAEEGVVALTALSR